MKETTQKKCPNCSSLHVHDNKAIGFSTSQYWQPKEEKMEKSDNPIYNCRNCGMQFLFFG
jgi:DNA-directed RNA polymerase subunit RPC12/RpoP